MYRVIMGILILGLAIVYADTQISANQKQTEQKPLENFLTLVLSFGDKDIPDEYLLARPQNIAVNNAGDIYIFDESRIKIFDKTGKPKKIIGRPGQGPGEFDRYLTSMYFDQNGYLWVIERNYYSLFSPEDKLINKYNIPNNNAIRNLKYQYTLSLDKSFGSSPIIFLNENEIIIASDDVSFEKDNNEYYDYLFYINKNQVTQLAKYKKVDTFVLKQKDSNSKSSISILGSFFCAVLPNNNIVYTHTFNDVMFEKATATLTFHIISLPDNKKRDFKISYPLQEFPKSTYDNSDPSKQEPGSSKFYIEQLKFNALKKRKYQPPFASLYNDGNYFFLENEDEKEIGYVQVINMETGKTVSHIKMPELSGYLYRCIKNGYSYRIAQEKDEYPRIEVYRIDPKVYGK